MIRDPNRAAALAAATLTSLLTSFMASALNIALPQIADEFSLDAVLLGWIATSFLLATAVFTVPFGKIADIYGRRRIFLGGTVLYTVSTLMAGLAGSAAVLIVARVLQGIGSAMIFSSNTAILTSVFSPGERGRVLGLNVAAVYIGLSVGPFVGGLLTQHLGWRSVFLATAPIGAIAASYIAWRLTAEWREARGDRFDVGGALLYALGLSALIWGVSQLSTRLGPVLILAGAAGLAAFAMLEARVPAPVFDVRLFRHNRVFALSSLAALISYAATAAVGFLLSLYLQRVRGLSPQQAGMVLLAQPIMMALFSPLSGKLSDRVEPRILSSAGMGVTAAGLLLFALLGPATPVVTIVLRLMLLGLGFALFSSPNMNAIMGSVERRLYGVASGTTATVRTIGGTLSLSLAAMIIGLFVGRVEITPDTAPAFLAAVRLAFGIFGAVCIGGVFASLARGRLHSS